MRRPSTSSAPRSSNSSAERSPSGISMSPAVAWSGMADPMAVLPRADVPGGVQRQPAQRARRPSGGDKLERALRERPGGPRGDPHPQHGGPVRRDLVGQRLDRLVALLLYLDDHPVAVAIPGQGYGADPKLLGQRQVERTIVAQRGRRGGRNGGAAAGLSQHLVKELVDSFCQQADLELLQDDAGHPATGAGLQVEGPVSRLPY